MIADQKCEWPAGADQSAKQTNNVATITPAQKIGNPAYLIARLTLAGHLVHRGSEHDFDVIHRKHGMSRWCQDLDALHAFAGLLGVQHA